MKRHSSLAFIPSLALIAAATPAVAHPHVWTAMQTAIITNSKGQISGIGVIWHFDELYTQYALEGLDTNGNGSFEPSEIAPLTEENIKSLLESNYFTYVRQGGQTLKHGPVTQYGQTLEDGRLTLSLIVPLATPSDPKQGEITVQVYDPDYFIAFDYLQDEPVAVKGALQPGCKMQLMPLPTSEEIDQTRLMLAGKDQYWQPEEPIDFGSMFAQKLVVSCS